MLEDQIALAIIGTSDAGGHENLSEAKIKVSEVSRVAAILTEWIFLLEDFTNPSFHTHNPNQQRDPYISLSCTLALISAI